MEIKRPKYLDSLIARMDNGLIKVVTGIRRGGKTYLLFEIFRKHLIASGVEATRIIGIRLDHFSSRRYRAPEQFLAYVNSKMTAQGRYYLLVDEVQLLGHFEEVLNELLHDGRIDIYVTGSNAKFLSRDVITEFRGRGDEVRIYPLTLSEFMQAYDGNVQRGWADYMLYGGLPSTVTMKTEEQKVAYLSSVFEETYLRDILERNSINKTGEFSSLIDVLASATGSLTNPSRLEATFRSVTHSSISRNTIEQYLSYLTDAFIVSEAKRYDVKGRKYIGAPLKYYFEDVGLRNARIGFRQTEENHLMENIVYNELRARGFSASGVETTQTAAPRWIALIAADSPAGPPP
ncbi:MAG: ATP-binding protein, partial [Oscillospiraceae bacterium]|nr:ATP-binding protein [Oscillospiraceae bacterium]